MSYVESGDELTSNYLSNHWHGRHSLAWSYWLNGTIVVIGCSLAVLLVLQGLESSGASLRLIAAAALFSTAAVVAVWLWAVVGIWRSATRHVEHGGRTMWATAAKVMVVLGAVGMAGQASNLGQQSAEWGKLAFGHDSMGAPAAVRITTGETLEIDGPLSLGAAERVSEALSVGPNLQRVVLNSTGGRMLEAQRIADLVRRRQLRTVVQQECSSACVSVLLAGAKRELMPNARVGLHQPSFPGMSAEDHAASVAQTRADYIKAGVDADFVDRALKAAPEDMWYPTEDELIGAGVLTGISRESIIADNAASASEINGRAPSQLDEVTVLTRAEADGLELSFHHRVLARAEEFAPGFLSRELPETISKQVCSEQLVRRLIGAGGKYRFIYEDEQGLPLTQFSVKECD